MHNKEFINKGLDPDKAKYKLPIDFEGMIGFWSDLDGYQIYNCKSLITIEEKAFWGSENGAKFTNSFIIDHLDIPAIVFYTSSQRDHIRQGDTTVKIKNSIVVDYHTNTKEFEYFLVENEQMLSTRLILNNKSIVEAVQIWKDFLNKAGYWKDDPRL